MWLLSTALFGWYLQHYADYSVIYGSLGLGIALLVWMYLISLVILIGAEFNACSSRAVSRRFRLREWIAKRVNCGVGIQQPAMSNPLAEFHDHSLDPAVRGFLHSPQILTAMLLS